MMMRIRRFRFTVRRLMVAVAVFGLAFSYIARYYTCKTIAYRHRQLVQNLLDAVQLSHQGNEYEDYHLIRFYVYEDAASRPWVSVPLRFVPFDEYQQSESASASKE
jgi:hypothetical protein